MVKGVFFLRKISFIFFLFFSVMSFTFSSFAGVASGSNAVRVSRASWSNASKAWDDFKDSFDKINDVQFNDMAVYSSSDALYTVQFHVSDDTIYEVEVGKNGVAEAPTLTGDKFYTEINLDVPKNLLPSYGKYKFTFSFFDVSQTVRSAGKDNVSADYFVVGDNQKNVSNSYSDSKSITVDKSANLWTAKGGIEISGKTFVVGYHMRLYNDVKIKNIKLNFRDIKIEVAGSSESIIVTSPSTNNQNSMGAVADATNALVDKQDSIIDQIVDTTQTISNQLFSFWNQLAGEFTNLYNKMNNQHSEDLAKVDEQISADRQNTDDLINNQDKNTDQITGGYDSSGLDSSGNKLNDSLTGLEDNENAIHDQASGWITDFTLPNFDQLLESGGILAACLWLGQFWQSMFTNMGAFNIPVTLSLCLIFVLMLVGYHRFKR